MKIENILRKNIEEYLLDQYSISSLNFDISRTKKDFVGHLTVIQEHLIDNTFFKSFKIHFIQTENETIN